VRHKLFELLFDDEPLAEQTIDAYYKHLSEILQTLRARISTDSSRTAWVKQWVGSYSNPELGPLTISPSGTDYVLTTASWSTRIGVSRESNGDQVIHSMDPPFTGVFAFITRMHGNERRLLLNAGQVQYWFDEETRH